MDLLNEFCFILANLFNGQPQASAHTGTHRRTPARTGTLSPAAGR